MPPFDLLTRASVGAGVPANTGEAGASLRVVFFAGMPAPTALPKGLAYSYRNSETPILPIRKIKRIKKKVRINRLP